MAALGRTLCRITKQRWLSVANINRQSLPLQSHFFLRKEVNFSSQVDKPKAIELTDPTKDPEYAEAVERFRDISDPEEV
ncbi:NDUFB11 [Bugula neritina]|uniref:NDUFB11 n=1 Tax=Bugula neritina TaxID=10212 RepID=A0A7J7JVH9_BUGNE|nr:NDUFB11 [Bugula neritina]